MLGFPAWIIAAGSLAAGVGSLGLVWYLNQYRGSPGADWFILTLCAQALWTLAYGVGVLLFDPPFRLVAEALTWIGIAWLGPLFFGFALKYTGRTELFRSWGFRSVFVAPVAGTALVLTHPFHELLWREFRIEPLMGLATVQYTIQPAAYLVAAVSLITAGVGVLLLVETILNYGPLYRREAIAVALSTVAPAGATIAWLLGISPWPGLNLAPVMFLPHVALDAYAFVGTHMFDTNPATQRAAEQSALERLDSPLLVVDPGERVVKLNGRAADLFDLSGDASLPVALGSLVGSDLETLRGRGEYESDVDDRVFAVSISPLTDPRGEAVGQLVVLYDITAERRQQEQLTVLNRVLRHNLRNELTVIQGRANLIARSLEDSQADAHVETVLRASRRLLSISSKARDFDRLSDRGPETGTVDVETFLDDVAAELREAHPEATIEVKTPATAASIRTDAGFLSTVLENLVENAIVHAPDDAPAVRICVRSGVDERHVVFEVRDENPRIAATEINAIRNGGETSLRHGSGIGLWIVAWCVRALDGEIEFTYDDGNVVTVILPDVSDPTLVTAESRENATDDQRRERSLRGAPTSNDD